MFNNIHRFNFYRHEAEAKKGLEAFTKYLDEIYSREGTKVVIEVIKASGISVNIFESPQRKQFFTKVIDHFKEKATPEDVNLFLKLETEVSNLEFLFEQLNNKKEEYFNKLPNETDDYKVVSYLISLEIFLTEVLKDDGEALKRRGGYKEKSELFDTAIESTGMVLKYFLYKKYPFKGLKRNISPQNIDLSSAHVVFSGIHEVALELLEYWQYSEVEVRKLDTQTVAIKINDEIFEYSNLISNERFQNFRQSWQLNALGTVMHNKEKLEENYDSIKSSLINLFATLYFGSPALDAEVESIELKKWLFAYNLLVKECERYRQSKRSSGSLNLSKVCLVKSKNQWKKLFLNNGFTKDETETIISIFTFKKDTQDLVDAPFIEIEDNLALIPSLTSQCDAARALSSNFINHKFNLSFKGPGFEQRTISDLQRAKLKARGLYKKIEDSEYECDAAFVINNDLFFVECKAHIQPYTPRQHADHLKKLYEETFQLNRIANFYSENINFVRNQMDLDDNFQPENVYRILLTTSMIGIPLFINGVYIIDESAFNTFLTRTAPSLSYQAPESKFKVSSKNFDIYTGEITTDKLIDFLSSPPAIEINKEFLKEKTVSTEFFQVTRKLVHNPSVHIGGELDDSDKKLMQKYFGK